MPPDRQLTVPEAAERLRLSEETVRRWLRSGKLRGVRLGGTKAGYRVSEAEVERLLNPDSVDSSSD